MPLVANPLPSLVPTRALPIDVNLLFAQNQTFTASGFLNNGASTIQLDVGPGRLDGVLVVDLQVLKVSAGNESYRLFLLGSNDSLFGVTGQDNADVLVFHDWAATSAGRLLPTICCASPLVPPPYPGYGAGGPSVRRHALPFSNEIGGFVLRYLQAYLVVGGTSPSVKLSSWVTEAPR